MIFFFFFGGGWTCILTISDGIYLPSFRMLLEGMIDSEVDVLEPVYTDQGSGLNQTRPTPNNKDKS